MKKNKQYKTIQTNPNQVDAKTVGLKGTSIFAEYFPSLDVVYGYILEYGHKIAMVIPSTFWKKIVFAPYKRGDLIPPWVMKNENRKLMSQRIQSMQGTHEMKKFRDPSQEKLKADEWLDWTLTVSIEATQGLIPDFVLEIWAHFRNAVIILMYQNDVTKDREKAKNHLKQAAKLAEKVFFSKLSSKKNEIQKKFDQTTKNRRCPLNC